MDNEQAKVEHLPGLVCTKHFFDVPLDYSKSGGSNIKVFAREVVSIENAKRSDLPWLVFLQGGPGFQSPRPEASNGWLKRALREFRVLLLDQRGTGLSSPVNFQTLAKLKDAQAQFDYVKHFRADNIVRDCEHIRKLIGDSKPWTILGQSYGGYCATTYLSIAPDGLKAVLLTGGLPPLKASIDDVYRALYKQAIARNNLFYERFPDDAAIVKRVVDYLTKKVTYLPSGERLSPSRFLQLGLSFGFACAGAGMNSVHYLLEDAFVGDELSYSFLVGLERKLSFDTNPVYALLHEPLYCEQRASNWSAARIAGEFPEFALESNRPFFTSEMIYPWMFDEYRNLKPLKELGYILAEYADWPNLYDVEVLSKNTVPVAACIYYSDIYVDRMYSEQTAVKIRGTRFWVTNEYEHDGLHQDGEKIIDRLLQMTNDPYV